jgi:meiotic recombination protein DMC1
MISLQGSSFATGVEVQDKRRRVHAISTGSKAVDAILGGELLLFAHLRLL